MKILIDIGHPGHVHYFRNLYKTMSQSGHQFLVIARDREVIKSLLDYYQIQFISRGKGRDSAFGKLAYMIYADGLILKQALRFKPDIFLSFSSPYAAQVSSLMNVPHIALNDTEHTDRTHKKFTYPFSQSIITPASYQNDLGHKQIRFNNVIESLYLHPKQYKPDPSIYELLGIARDIEYVIVRFVSWNAFHDVNQHGLLIEQKRQAISLLEKKYRVFISSERNLDTEFSSYQIRIPPERMHDALAFATLFVSESGTMASESAILGTPVVYVNSLPLMCYLKLEQEYGILKHFKSGVGVWEYINSLIDNPNLKLETQDKRDQMVKDFINPTEFLVWFIVNYPESPRIMKENPDFQYTFK
jgi:predicted glycosyltransferase